MVCIATVQDGVCSVCLSRLLQRKYAACATIGRDLQVFKDRASPRHPSNQLQCFVSHRGEASMSVSELWRPNTLVEDRPDVLLEVSRCVVCGRHKRPESRSVYRSRKLQERPDRTNRVLCRHPFNRESSTFHGRKGRAREMCASFALEGEHLQRSVVHV